MQPARDSLPTGEQINCYRVVEMIGKGGFSLVYLAINDEDGEEVVVKEYMPKRLARRAENGSLVPIDRDQRENLARGRMQFFQEATAMALLRHPHIVAVRNLFLANNTAYIVMEYQRGRNLGELIQQRKRLSATLTVRIFLPLLDALATMHARSMVHLDLKPGNVHLRSGHDPLLLDLGAMRLLQGAGESGSRVITAGYSPPEQYRRSGSIGPWTDVYAIGASLRCCLEGKTPRPSPKRLAGDELTPATLALRDSAPVWLLELIDAAMALEPEQRPKDAGEVLRVLRESLGSP